MTMLIVNAPESTGQDGMAITDARIHWFVGQHASDQTPDTRRPERLLLTPATWADVGAAF
ncbi:MAG: hypothetical protein EOO75_19830 [Myxococcales bacterium]|nr:MAG: hypothetical protein EOO75_19830 [Myxococcales bacterium]